MISRRDFLKVSMAGSAASFLAGQARFTKRAFALQNPQIPLPGSAIPQFNGAGFRMHAFGAGRNEIDSLSLHDGRQFHFDRLALAPVNRDPRV